MKLTPRIPITDPRFEYTSADKTDIRKRFTAARNAIAERKAIESADTTRVVELFNQRREQGS